MSEQSRSARWYVKFVVFSALVGPLILRPPVWPEYRREQLTGFAIGMVSWSLAAASLLAIL